MPITTDTINEAHKVIYGIPSPDEDYCNNYQGSERIFESKYIDTYYLDDFPPGILPSGGDSCVISESEMVMLLVSIRNNTDKAKFRLLHGDEGKWHNVRDKIISTEIKSDIKSSSRDNNSDSIIGLDHSYLDFWSYDFVFFGRFDWEINKIGRYAIDAIYPIGMVRWEFDVV